jgi:4-alpha-glucanotransferase
MYLDLPLGVHPHGYDVWRHRALFATDVSVGAPPDAVFVSGQDWGFPPLDPGRLREQHCQYVIAYLRHHLQHARILRIDHVMGLHRLFWIPKGLGAGEGVYVRYPAEEFYAILSLESRRHNAWIVGENLGTVPSYVSPAMRRHNIQSMYVVHYEQASDAHGALRAVPTDCVASINTHDMPPFAASWRDSDIDDRLKLGLLDRTGARTERRARREQRRSLMHFLERKGLLVGASADPRRVLRAILAFLSASPARTVLVNLEDLWLETRHQNIPGTHDEHPNWQRKARYSLEAFREMPEVLDALREVDHVRKRGRG